MIGYGPVGSELANVLLPPFEMALRAGARSVMNNYCDLDGVPVAANPELLTERLPERLPQVGSPNAVTAAAPAMPDARG